MRKRGKIGRGGTGVFAIGPLEPCPPSDLRKNLYRAKMQNIVQIC